MFQMNPTFEEEGIYGVITSENEKKIFCIKIWTLNLPSGIE